MASSDVLNAKLTAAFQPLTFLEVTDESGGCGAKFVVTVVTPAFDGVPLLERHRRVNAALAEELRAIHALSIKALTPAQYEQKKAAGTL
jgi:stress-induced morphogen